MAPLSCPEYQEGIEGSCYEFLSLPRSSSFLSAQGLCERGGGHLAFILNDGTQQFLQMHLQPEQDWWLGLAPASPNLTLDFAAAEGPLSWLDGSDVSYSNSVNDPDPGAGCGHILRSSVFQWENLGTPLLVLTTMPHYSVVLVSWLLFFDNVSITLKWLLHPFQGNLTCTLSAGDGHNIDPYSPEELESSMVHKYTYPGVFMGRVECTTSEWHVTAQKAITIQKPIGEFGVIKCYSMNQSTDGANCKAL
ncbi:polycystic kidney disease protein 1-like 2 [Oncorhynchus mykiss]|uniref:polycystic kidney disease protein 1-like 2 n=1 Tax=Oncorhynchus mykiss TaxID=8022 RepID=UPI00187761C8|nr:polycystic kidney disease protein 1-like 2 [Oncorhynchus mykiss]